MSDKEHDETTSGKPNEPKSISYPLKIVYCPECSLPLEFCEFMPESVLQRCKAWREKNQDLLEQEGVSLSSLSLDDAVGDKKRQKRGGRGNIKSKPKKEPDIVRLARIPRGKRKYVTRVTGLATYDINLKKASKLFAQKFSCGSSVSGEDEIIVQGDVTDDLIDLILETFEESASLAKLQVEKAFVRENLNCHILGTEGLRKLKVEIDEDRIEDMGEVKR